MANIPSNNKKRQTTNQLTEQFITFVTGHTFGIVVDIILVIYSVTLAHAAITGHPIDRADMVVMIGLGTVEASLVSLILRVKTAKIDSHLQYKVAIGSIAIITTAMALNALSGVAVIQQTPIAQLANFVSYGTPLVPVLTLILVFAVDASSDYVQGQIQAAITAQKLQSTLDQQLIDEQDASADTLRLELERAGAKRTADRARIAAQVEIAKAEAVVLATVATKSASVRKTAMIEYVEGDEFKRNQERTARAETLALLKAATQSTANGNTPNA